jgi:tetratricopeptide (TPR) repeat protein
LIPRRIKPQQRPIDAAKMFAVEISEIVNNLVKEFRQFITANGLPVEGEDTRRAFFQFLSTSGQAYALKEKLLPFVQRIVREKFNKKPGTTAAELDKVYNELYVYLLEQLHATLNKVFSRETLSQRTLDTGTKVDNKWKRLADEAEVIQEFALASRYHQERLVHGPEEGEPKEDLPDVWCEYAEFCLRVRDAARAEQAYREAIAIDIAHTPSLLGYGLLLLSRGRYKESEVYLQSAVDVAIESVVTWTALGLYYECHEQLLGTVGDEDNGARRAKSQREARYCITEAGRHLTSEDVENGNTPYFMLAKYLLELHLEELALLCLKQCNAKAPETLYALGRLYYQTMQYEEAASQVKDLMGDDNFQAQILMGDIRAQENKGVEAEVHYERALRVKPEGATGGVYVRLGNIYMTLGRYKEAKDTFIIGVRVWCCGLTWMGVGIAYYRMDDYIHAEQALNESNILNNQNPKTWAYLCLCCLKTRRDEEADFALNQALKLHLGDVDLLCEIGVEQQSLGRLKLCEGIFRKCVSLNATYSTRLLFAQTLMAMRSWEEAQSEFSQAYALAQNETERSFVEEQLRLLEAMQSDQ